MTTVPSLHPGQRALLEAPTTPEPLELVVGRVDGNRVTLDGALGSGDLPTIGSPVRLVYLDRYGVYAVDATIETTDGDTLVAALAPTADGGQRRQFVRVAAPVPASCLLHEPAKNRFTQFTAEVVDIGGGGLALAADAIAPWNAIVVVSITLPDGPPVVAVGTVLDADADRRIRSGRHTLRLQFTLISELDRDRILAFTFAALRTAPPG